MPRYEFRCNDTGKLFEVQFSYMDYDPTQVTSPFTGSHNVTRIIRKVRISRSEEARWDRIESDDDAALAELEHADPQTLGRALRHFSHQLDNDEIGPEFSEVVERLESGQSPEEIERSMDAEVPEPPPPETSSPQASEKGEL